MSSNGRLTEDSLRTHAQLSESITEASHPGYRKGSKEVGRGSWKGRPPLPRTPRGGACPRNPYRTLSVVKRPTQVEQVTTDRAKTAERISLEAITEEES